MSWIHFDALDLTVPIFLRLVCACSGIQVHSVTLGNISADATCCGYKRFVSTCFTYVSGHQSDVAQIS
eukprot:6195698-Pleurochrysis_carterae.AAC.1